MQEGSREHLRLIQRHVANVAIGASTLRNQGDKGVVHRARKYLSTLKLDAFAACVTGDAFNRRLGLATGYLSRTFPEHAKGNWSAARKALNIFLRDACYNRFLCSGYRLAHLMPWLELPLDGDAMRGIRGDARKDVALPATKRIRYLSPKESALFQAEAAVIARHHGCRRVELDHLYWRS